MSKPKRQNTLTDPVPPPATPAVEPKPIPPSPITGVALPAGSQWPKGVSANPGGAPKGKRVSTRMMEMMHWTREQLQACAADETAEVRDALAAKCLLRAMKNDDANADMNTVLDRTEGKVAQDFNLRAAPTLKPEEVAEQLKNAGLLGGAAPDDF